MSVFFMAYVQVSDVVLLGRLDDEDAGANDRVRKVRRGRRGCGRGPGGPEITPPAWAADRGVARQGGGRRGPSRRLRR